MFNGLQELEIDNIGTEFMVKIRFLQSSAQIFKISIKYRTANCKMESLFDSLEFEMSV